MALWIQKAIKRPGRVRKYLLRRFGRRALTRNGELKHQYVLKAIRELKERPPSARPKGLLQALHLAKRLETMHKDRKTRRSQKRRKRRTKRRRKKRRRR